MTGAAELEVHPGPEQAASSLADEVVSGVRAARSGGRRYLLGCPGGRSAAGFYTALADRIAAERVPIDHLVIVMMDEYVTVTDGVPHPVAADLAHSCRRFGRIEILEALNAGTDAPIPAEQLWVPDPQQPGRYDAEIAGAGGIDHFLLASGSGDGHVAFNPPGSPRDSRTRVIELAEQTRRDNLRTFPTFGGLADVPRHGVSVGIGTIIEQSAAATLIVHGPEKTAALARVLAVADYDPSWPASVVHACRQSRILTDADTLARAGRPAAGTARA